MAKFRSVGLLVLALVLLSAAAGVMVLIFWPHFHQFPEEMRISLVVPAGADVLPSDKVKPGTFNLETSVEDIMRLAANQTAPAQRAIVAFGRGTASRDDAVVVEYWLPRGDGSSVFYHARLLHRAPFGSRAYLGSVRREGEVLVLTPVGVNKEFHLVTAVFLTIMGLTCLHLRQRR